MRGSIVGISDGFHHLPAPSSQIHSIFLEFLDIILSSFVIAPCVIGYWRGTWDLMEHYIIPSNKIYSATTSFLIGIFGHIVFTLLQRYLKNIFNPDKHRLIFYTFSRCYTAIFGVVCVNGWRGAWLLTDIYTGFNLYIVILVTSTAILLLIFMRTSRNLGAAPFALAMDTPQDYFDITTMFKTSSTREPGLWILDCMFSILTVGTLVVVAWRGVWVFFDLTLYPDNQTFSAWGSLVIGYGIVAFTFAIQPIIRWICDRVTGLWRITVADIFLFISFIGTVNAWRGIWHLLDIYFLPDNRLVSDWTTHLVSFIILMLINCSNSVLVRGVFIDGEEPAGQCVIFPIYYIRLHFQKERRKKQIRLLDTLEKQNQNSTVLLLDKITVTHNNIKIIKSDSGGGGVGGGVGNKISKSTVQNCEIKPMISQTTNNEKTRNSSNRTSIKE